ncbi:hypothetical protein QYM36_012773 [Artemia franciscana]|uniref:Endonuclease/exonuclease/phosphatase domain-containing protein n=1 Tax=Artemia franciscana TaxID=6661 RepID=A0AA88L0F4_ARTSF|nr:hypothetical protein QYM36_012773 [Artemia franciscana]
MLVSLQKIQALLFGPLVDLSTTTYCDVRQRQLVYLARYMLVMNLLMKDCPLYLKLLVHLPLVKGDATLNMAAKSKNLFNAINLGKPTTVIKQAKSRINVGCWNVRSAKQEATQAFLVHEMEKYNIDILCISETRISGSGSIVITAPETLHQFHFFYSGIEDNSGLHGVGFIMNQRTRNALLEREPVSSRLARIRLKGNPANVSIISTYAPTRDATETTKDDFYGELQQSSSSIAARDYLIAAGDFNARVGPSDQTTRQILGKFGQGHRCENGQRLVNYALMNHLVITNTIFQHKLSHLLTWHSNDGVTKAQIDFILVRQRWRSSVQDSRSYNGADTGSQSEPDYRLVAAKILLRLAIRRKNKSKVGFDIVRDIAMETHWVKNCFLVLLVPKKL